MKNAIAASRSSTTMPTLSIRLKRHAAPLVVLSLETPTRRAYRPMAAPSAPWASLTALGSFLVGGRVGGRIGRTRPAARWTIQVNRKSASKGLTRSGLRMSGDRRCPTSTDSISCVCSSTARSCRSPWILTHPHTTCRAPVFAQAHCSRCAGVRQGGMRDEESRWRTP